MISTVSIVAAMWMRRRIGHCNIAVSQDLVELEWQSSMDLATSFPFHRPRGHQRLHIVTFASQRSFRSQLTADADCQLHWSIIFKNEGVYKYVQLSANQRARGFLSHICNATGIFHQRTARTHWQPWYYRCRWPGFFMPCWMIENILSLLEVLHCYVVVASSLSIFYYR